MIAITRTVVVSGVGLGVENWRHVWVSTAEATRRFAPSSGDAVDNVANPIQVLPFLGRVAALSKVRRDLIEPVLWIRESDLQEAEQTVACEFRFCPARAFAKC